MTNHHVAAAVLQRLGSKARDLYRNGFQAATQTDEIKCPALELNVLMNISDVTARVKKAVAPGLADDKAAAARRAVINEIEKEAAEKSKLKSQVVTLYQGGAFHLYQYKRWTDVRLVFAPEHQIAFYGGDADNFEYPRYDLDVTFFRVYEEGKPARTPDYLKWSRKAVREDELVFVSGHPGRTTRLAGVAELLYLRDVGVPLLMQRLNRLEVLYSSYSDRSAENRRQAKSVLFSVQNSRKKYVGEMAALLEPSLLDGKRKEEEQLRRAADTDEQFKTARSAWKRLEAAQKVRSANSSRYSLLEGAAGLNSHLFSIARILVRGGDELKKPNARRLREFSEANLASLKLRLFSPEPIYDELETARLADSLTYLSNELGPDNPLVRKVLAGKSPRRRAHELVSGTRVKDVGVRKKLFEGGREALDAFTDPMLDLVRIVDPEARAVRKLFEEQVSEVMSQASAEIAKVRFALEGSNTYPDATSSLRLAFGQVKGYEEDGKNIPFRTTFAGLYERSAENDNKPPFDLPPLWVKRKDRLDLATPMNFVCTADIIGGNSGSPVINCGAEVVGLIFDGNIQSLAWGYAYGDRQGRAIAVAAQGIIEALRKVYDANGLADELLGLPDGKP
jgi:hypothetical protein